MEAPDGGGDKQTGGWSGRQAWVAGRPTRHGITADIHGGSGQEGLRDRRQSCGGRQVLENYSHYSWRSVGGWADQAVGPALRQAGRAAGHELDRLIVCLSETSGVSWRIPTRACQHAALPQRPGMRSTTRCSAPHARPAHPPHPLAPHTAYFGPPYLVLIQLFCACRLPPSGPIWRGERLPPTTRLHSLPGATTPSRSLASRDIAT